VTTFTSRKLQKVQSAPFTGGVQRKRNRQHLPLRGDPPMPVESSLHLITGEDLQTPDVQELLRSGTERSIKRIHGWFLPTVSVGPVKPGPPAATYPWLAPDLSALIQNENNSAFVA